MSFLLGALPTLFSSPFIRNTLSSAAQGLMNIISSNAKEAATSFVNKSVQQGLSGVQNFIKPIQGKRFSPFEDELEEEEETGMDFEDENQMDKVSRRPSGNLRRINRPTKYFNRKKLKR